MWNPGISISCGMSGCVFFEIKTLPLHKNNGDVLPSLWV